MDVISLSKAKKAKKAIKAEQDRLGMNGTESGKLDIKDVYLNLRERLKALEAKSIGNAIKEEVSDLEKNTAVNLNKHNLRVAAFLNISKYEHKDMIFNNLKDALSINAVTSSNIVHNTSLGIIKQSNQNTPAEVVFVKEDIADIHFISVSLAYTGMPSLLISLDNGMTFHPIEMDELINVGKMNTTSELVIKVVLESGQELQAIAYSFV